MNEVATRGARGRAWIAAGLVLGGALLLTAFAGAPAEAKPRVIKMKGNSPDNYRFEGDRAARSGAQLRVVNRSSAPHTFTLVQKRLLRRQSPEQRCFKEGRLCDDVLDAHEAQKGDLPELLDFGAEGWDKPFTKRNEGDSWYTAERGDRVKQAVSAPSGKKRFYFCAIHPYMQGKIRVR